jgi:RNA polymerase sigma-70 factor (ECF subfamily)
VDDATTATTDPIDPIETIDAARAGDRAAQARLLTALQDVWYRFCLSLLHDADEARDATQETALRFLRQLPSFRGDSRLRTWSLSIALNVVREIKRKRRAASDDAGRLYSAPEHTCGEHGRTGSGGLDALETSESQQMLHSNLDQLSERQREALVLRFFEDLTVEQTATAMGCAAGTVKATVHQALRALRAKMTQSK